MDVQEKQLIIRIAELVEVYQGPTIEEYLDEMFQNHLELTSMSGKPLSDGYYLITQIKQIFKVAAQITNAT